VGFEAGDVGQRLAAARVVQRLIDPLAMRVAVNDQHRLRELAGAAGEFVEQRCVARAGLAAGVCASKPGLA
jgi:hypothetical protein